VQQVGRPSRIPSVTKRPAEVCRLVLVVCACAVTAAALLASQSTVSQTLRLYFIDVEGGQATLIVASDAESLLVDTGYGAQGRDSGRIIEAMHDAGISRIDRLLLTHFHVDHIGGVVELANRVPIGAVYDHGDIGVPDDAVMKDAFERYRQLREHLIRSQPRVGTQLRLGEAVLTWVSSDTQTLHDSLPSGGTANPACAAEMPEAEDPDENPRSTGFLLQLGRFRFLDVADLTGAPLAALVCPANRIGRIDAYVLPHHGEEDGAFPATLDAFRPRAIILNNGPRKGARAGTLDLLHTDAAMSDVWQLHRATNPQVHNFPDDRIANLDESAGHWLKIVAADDGSFSVANQRTGNEKSYPPRQLIR
jgi:competence protein ComEC